MPAYHAAAVPVKIEEMRGSALVEPDSQLDDCLQVDKSLVEVNNDGLTTLLIINNGKSPCQLKSGLELAQACEVELELLNGTSLAQTDAELSGSSETQSSTEHERLQNMLPVEVECTSEPQTSNVQPSEQLMVWTVNLLSNGNVGSNEHIQWRQQQLRKTFIESGRQLSGE